MFRCQHTPKPSFLLTTYIRSSPVHVCRSSLPSLFRVSLALLWHQEPLTPSAVKPSQWWGSGGWAFFICHFSMFHRHAQFFKLDFFGCLFIQCKQPPPSPTGGFSFFLRFGDSILFHYLWQWPPGQIESAFPQAGTQDSNRKKHLTAVLTSHHYIKNKPQKSFRKLPPNSIKSLFLFPICRFVKAISTMRLSVLWVYLGSLDSWNILQSENGRSGRNGTCAPNSTSPVIWDSRICQICFHLVLVGNTPSAVPTPVSSN